MSCSSLYRGRLSGGFTFPAGAYATDIPPWDSKMTQRDLSALFYGGDLGQDVSGFVAVDGAEFYPLPYAPSQWVRQCPAGAFVPVDTFMFGPNLMDP